MTQRTLAAVIAIPVVIVLLAVAWVAPLPFTIFRPGPTVDMMGEYDEKPIIDVSGHQTYDTSGELRLTTVSETTRSASLSLWTLMGAWLSDDSAILPLEVAHPDTLTEADEKQQGQIEMATSQEGAIAAALTKLGYKNMARAGVAEVVKGGPSDGTLKKDDLLLKVGGQKVATPDDVVTAAQSAQPGQPLNMVVLRDDERQRVVVTPDEKDGKGYLGISVGADYQFPFDVSLNIDPAIGGPSAGLIMAMSVYDALTPGSLIDGQKVAGTGTIDLNGAVGAIGGIQQKIPGADDVGAELFLVPADNCKDVAGADPGDMRLAKVSTLTDAIDAVTTWTNDPDADLPTCGQ